MRILLAVKSLLPSYGGPAFSVSQLALALANTGASIGIWTSDMSAAKSSLSVSHPRVEPLTGPIVKAFYRFGTPDIVHDNGIWLPHNHLIAQLAKRQNLVRVVSIRGMLEPWALKHKRLKKKMAWWLYQRGDLCRASCHHATAELEAESLIDLQLRVPVRVIPNGVDISEIGHGNHNPQKVRTVLFLGRIHPVKGLWLLLDAWSRLRPKGWQLQIAGPDETGTKIDLEKKAASASLSDVIHFLGPLDGEAKEAAFANADIFVLPSFSESFGMAIGEALAHGVPVLTTFGTPWHMLEARGCGWTVDPTVDGVIEGLRQATSRGSECLRSMGERGREFIRTEFGWDRVAGQFISLYEALLSGQPLQNSI